MGKKKIRKIILIICLLIIFVSIVLFFIFPPYTVTCESNSEVWAIKPRTTIENVIVYEADQGDQFQYAGIYQDVSGQEWYVVSGILKIDPNAGLNEGYILKEDCSLGWQCTNDNNKSN